MANPSLTDQLARQRIAELHTAACREHLASTHGPSAANTRLRESNADHARHAPRPHRGACYQSRDATCRALRLAQGRQRHQRAAPNVRYRARRRPRPARSRATRPSREITDPKAMRALAHPLRLAILDAMRNEGELTATRAAELLHQSPATCPGICRRSPNTASSSKPTAPKDAGRPWKIAPGTNNFNPSEAIPESFDALEHLAITVLDRSFEQLQEWWRQHKDFGDAWFTASFINEKTSFLTSAELAEIREQIDQLLRRSTSAQTRRGDQPTRYRSTSSPSRTQCPAQNPTNEQPGQTDSRLAELNHCKAKTAAQSPLRPRPSGFSFGRSRAKGAARSPPAAPPRASSFVKRVRTAIA